MRRRGYTGFQATLLIVGVLAAIGWLQERLAPTAPETKPPIAAPMPHGPPPKWRTITTTPLATILAGATGDPVWEGVAVSNGTETTMPPLPPMELPMDDIQVMARVNGHPYELGLYLVDWPAYPCDAGTVYLGFRHYELHFCSPLPAGYKIRVDCLASSSYIVGYWEQRQAEGLPAIP